MTHRICRSVLTLTWVCLTLAAPAQRVQLVTTINPALHSPAGGDGDSYLPTLSPDGRFVLFASTADNLVLLNDGRPIPPVIPPPLNVFLRDRSNSTTVLVSVSYSGTGGADADVTPMGLSADGRFALFESAADNLVAGDTNGASDVFVRDLASGKTILVSTGGNGGFGNRDSEWSVMTPDGRFVAFVSDATNLVANDTNGMPDVFLRDLNSGVTKLVSAGAAGIAPANALAAENPPGITPDGRFVVFHSVASNLVAGVTASDGIYVRDMQQGITTQASGAARQAIQTVFGSGNLVTYNALISTNGQYVVYEASPTVDTAGLLLRYHLETGATELVHTNTMALGQGAGSLEITPDGETIAFVANANDNSGDTTWVLVWNGLSGTTTLASGDSNNQVTPDSLCFWPTLDAGGRFVAFLSDATGLVTNELPGDFHLYLRDLVNQTTTLVDADPNGAGSLLTSLPAPSLSADGRWVAFEAPDGGLVADDDNLGYDVFVRDVQNRQTELISAHTPALQPQTPNGDSSLGDSSVSANGMQVVFWSDSDSLVDNDTNGLRDVFLRDLVSSNNILVSVGTNGVGADGASSEAVITPDGRCVAFSSEADNLVAGDNNHYQDVFVRDLQTGTTTLVSLNKDGTNSASGDSFLPAISSDGRFVLFTSQAWDLVPGSPTGVNLFLRDRQLGTNFALTKYGFQARAMSAGGQFVAVAATFNPFNGSPALYIWDTASTSWIYTNSTVGITEVALSPDGQHIVCRVSGSGVAAGIYAVDRAAQGNTLLNSNLVNGTSSPKFSADSRFAVYSAPLGTVPQVYLYDFQTGTNLLVSQQWGGGAVGNGNSDSPAISSDGRWVAYRSQADNLVPGDTNGVPDIFLFDRLSGNTTLVSANRFGTGVGDNRSLGPVFSGNGRTLFFVSLASDLVPNDFNHASDIFAFDLSSTKALTNFSARAALDAAGWRIEWPALPGRSYRIQFKNDLSDPAWQDLTEPVAIIGNAAYFTDRTATLTRRFYRVVAD